MYILFLACIFLHVIYAQTNITIDDPNSAIVYSPPSAWSITAPSPLDFDGAHHLSEGTSTATATFTFTGIAIYFMSPLWPYQVTTQLSVDGGPGQIVNLQDPSIPATNGGPETVASSAVWGMAGLTNTQHQLVISMVPGGTYVVVDGLIYTEATGSSPSSTIGNSPSPSSSSSRSPSSSSSSSSSSASSSPSPSPTSSPSHSNLVVPIAGAAAGLLALIVLAVLIFLCCRHRRKRDSLHDTSHLPSVAGSIKPESPSIHFSQLGVGSPAPSMITTNLAGYGAYHQPMPSLPEDHSYPVQNHVFSTAVPSRMHSAYNPPVVIDPARSAAMRNYASDPAIGLHAPNVPEYDTSMLYETGTSPGSRLSTVIEGSASQSGSVTNVQTPSSLGGRSTDVETQDGSNTLYTGSTSQPSSSSWSKGYTGRNYQSDQKEYLSDQKRFSSSPPLPRGTTPGPPAYSPSG